MTAEDILDDINKYNSNKVKLFNDCADQFISLVRSELSEIYSKGLWTQMVSVSQLGIVIKSMSPDFHSFKIDILSGFKMYDGHQICEDLELPTFKEFIESGTYKHSEINDFQNEDIIQIVPFYAALKRKGFEMIVDEPNYQLIVALDIEQ